MTGGYDRIESRTLTDTTSPAIDRATSTSSTGAFDFTANGTLLTLPAGAVSATFGGGTQTIRLDSAVIQRSGATAGSVARDIATGRVNLDVPLASRAGGSIGDLSVNANFLAQRLSDFGTLTTMGVGARWSPAKPFSVLVSMTDEDGPPTPQQLGTPTIRTPNAQVFDYSRGESATVTRIDGGTPGLTGDTRRVFKSEVSLKPLRKADFDLTATYVSSRIRNPIAAFPATTPQVEAAFPGRIGRDAAGRLISVDARPVNFAFAERSEFRWGLSYARSLGADRTPAGPRVPGAGAIGGGRSFGATGSRLQVSLFHTVHLTDRLTLRPGLTPLDLLGGDAVSLRGGQPRHELELSGNAVYHGFGLRFGGIWQSATTVASPDGIAAKTLRFGSIGTLNLRFFAFPAQQPHLTDRMPWLKGVRFLIAIDNLFDSRQRVTDATGATPLRYQPGYLDPLGRTLRLSVRKTSF
jgi:hypothetical protein